jgi:glutamine synthetase
MTTLNAIVAKQLRKISKRIDALIETKDMKKDDTIFNVLRNKNILKILLKETDIVKHGK